MAQKEVSLLGKSIKGLRKVLPGKLMNKIEASAKEVVVQKPRAWYEDIDYWKTLQNVARKGERALANAVKSAPAKVKNSPAFKLTVDITRKALNATQSLAQKAIQQYKRRRQTPLERAKEKALSMLPKTVKQKLLASAIAVSAGAVALWYKVTGKADTDFVPEDEIVKDVEKELNI